MNHQILDFRSAFVLIAAAACWGIATVITKSILASIPPITLLTIQLTFSISLLWALVYIKGRPLPRNTELLKVGSLGLLNPGLSYTLSLIGLTTTTASMSTLLWASEPVLIIGLAWLLLRERPASKLILFSITAILGVILISGLATNNVLGGHGLGNLLILGGVFCCAVYTVLARHFGSNVDPLIAVALQQTFALIWALVIWPLELRGSNPVNLLQLGASIWFWTVISGSVYYALAFWFYLRGLARVSASLAGAFINLIPIFGVSSAFIFLGERLSPIQWIGAAAILLSVFAIFLWQDRTMQTRMPIPGDPAG